LQTGSDHVDHGLLGVTQTFGRIDLDAAPDASALTTADIGTRG
jgi:hypothetical protein